MIDKTEVYVKYRNICYNSDSEKNKSKESILKINSNNKNNIAAIANTTKEYINTLPYSKINVIDGFCDVNVNENVKTSENISKNTRQSESECSENKTNRLINQPVKIDELIKNNTPTISNIKNSTKTNTDNEKNINTYIKRTHNNLIQNINSKINDTYSKLNTISINLERTKLPSFINKSHRLANLRTEKCKITFLLIQIDNLIKKLPQLYTNVILNNMQNYYNKKLQKMILEYKELETNFFNNYNTDYDTEKEHLLENINVYVEQKTDQIEHQIRNNIFNLTEILLQLKMVIYTQKEKINRLDEYLEEITEDLSRTNVVVKEIPEKHNRRKNKVIYVMCLVALGLICVDMVKAVKHRKMS